MRHPHPMGSSLPLLHPPIHHQRRPSRAQQEGAVYDHAIKDNAYAKKGLNQGWRGNLILALPHV